MESGMRSLEQKLGIISEKLPFARKFIEGRTKVNQRRMEVLSDILRKRGMDLHNSSILEVGSHIGFGLVSAETSLYRFGLEYYFENCKHARYIADVFESESICFVQGTASGLPFPPDTFDYIQSHHVIEHMPPEEWETYFYELARVLKPGGICLVSFPHWHHPIESHYGLPFLHWLPVKFRPRYASLTTRKDHIESAELAYEAVMSGKAELIFTEMPRISEVRRIVKKTFARDEDITREFARHRLIRDQLGPFKHKIAILLSTTWICPERKLLLYK